MSLVTLPLRLPLLPITALVRLAELIEQEAERQLDAEVRRRLLDAEDALMTGEATEEEVAMLEEQTARSLTGWRGDADPAAEELSSDA